MRELGITVVRGDAVALDDVGSFTAPAPIEPGDLVALEPARRYG